MHLYTSQTGRHVHVQAHRQPGNQAGSQAARQPASQPTSQPGHPVEDDVFLRHITRKLKKMAWLEDGCIRGGRMIAGRCQKGVRFRVQGLFVQGFDYQFTSYDFNNH